MRGGWCVVRPLNALEKGLPGLLDKADDNNKNGVNQSESTASEWIYEGDPSRSVLSFHKGHTPTMSS